MRNPRATMIVMACASAIGCAFASPRGSLQDALLFQPRPFTAQDERPSDDEFENAWFSAADGTRLHGWYLPVENPRAVVLYCHGNAGNIAGSRAVARMFRDHLHSSILVFDYRGYGKSEGKPTESGIIADARAARHWLAARASVTEPEIVLVGRSLGGAVAVNLAADGARGLVLENTFSSLPDLAAARLPLLPARALTSYQFDSAATIAAYRGPLLQSHGSADAVIPIALGRTLHERANRPKLFLTVEGGGHNDPPTSEYVAELRRFLDSLPSLEQGG